MSDEVEGISGRSQNSFAVVDEDIVTFVFVEVKRFSRGKQVRLAPGLFEFAQTAASGMTSL